MSKRQRARSQNRADRFRIEKCGSDEASFTEAFLLMVELHKEGGYAPLDAEKATGNFYTALKDDCTFVARKDGEMIGILSMYQPSFWFSQDSYLETVGFYVKPEHRKGAVGVELMRAVREEAQKRKKIAFVSVTSPDRRPKKTPLTLQAQIAGYVPLGYVIRMR